MDIKVISKSCAKIIITKEEAERFEIDFDSFDKDDTETKTFLGYIIAVMGDMGIISSPKDKISVEIFEQECGDLILYISSSPDENICHESAMICFHEPLEILDFLKSPSLSYFIEKDSAKLYLYNEFYCIIFLCRNCRKLSDNTISDNALIAKVKEYGKMICDTPFKTLI